jgi:lincosamide nucleotidyltransferase A/C/D/E
MPGVGPERTPRLDMEASDVVELVDCLEGAGVDVWLDGGWGVDALLGEQTRAHDDLDLIAPLSDVETIQEALALRGYALAGGAAPMSFELTDAAGRQVDVHPVVFTDGGDGVYRMRTGEDWIYPAAGFEGVGHVLGRRLRCLTPEVQLLCHGGYELDAQDVHDIEALRSRFGLEIGEEYLRDRPS